MIIHHIATEQVTVSSTAKTLTAAKVNTARADGFFQVLYADINVQDASIYVTFDGSTTPSATAGEIWNPGDHKRVWGRDNLANLQFIYITSDAVLEVNYWGN